MKRKTSLTVSCNSRNLCSNHCCRYYMLSSYQN